MDGQRCRQKGCNGKIEDGYCNVCGHAAERNTAQLNALSSSVRSVNGAARTATSRITGTGSSPLSRAARGTRRTHSASRTTRRQLGAGLVILPELPSADPEKSMLAEAHVPENKRYCPSCNAALRRETGFCGKCGRKYSFLATLNPGDLVAGQYEVRGALAYGGLGWIYLAFDKVLSRYVVLKGLLNAHDESSAATAVAERQFLASVKHPNIVGIYNFVQQASEGFIVMEYVGGKTLKQIRKERGPLPPAEAIAYIHRILGAFSYLHNAGLVYCDFKPDNVMLEKDDVKLIDMGGVRRANDMQSDIYGTAGYSAPEAGEGPTVASDLFTVARTLAVLLADIPGFVSENKYKMPAPGDVAVFGEQESLYRVLLKATAHNPDDRFQTADEMAEQLLGSLREIVAIESGTPRPSMSHYFSVDGLAFETSNEMEPVEPDTNHLPAAALESTDPGVQTVNTIKAAFRDPQTRAAALLKAQEQYTSSREVKFAMVQTFVEQGAAGKALALLDELAQGDAWDWRVEWERGKVHLASGAAKDAQREFDQVYFDLPGELAPKLALGLAAENAGSLDLAVQMYDTVSRVDDTYVSAAFGLARCLIQKGDRAGAVEALKRIPQTSGLFLRAQVKIARTLMDPDGIQITLQDLTRASETTDSLPLSSSNQAKLRSQILEAALKLLEQGKLQPDRKVKLAGYGCQERNLRTGLEKVFRSLAQLSTGRERLELVDRANAVRPMTLF